MGRRAASYTGVRLIDLDRDSIDVLLVIDSGGKLTVVSPNGAATWTTSCVASPSGKPWDGAPAGAATPHSTKGRVWELDGDGRDEVIAVRGRTFPGTTYYDGYTDI
ncbi:MAG: hypothetical protein IV100_25825, partial [Myxococcales bacterium]|nr:hypothetical protein [Myxococcales bacterium]